MGLADIAHIIQSQAESFDVVDVARRHAIKFVKDFFTENKPVAAICHGPQTLIDAEVIEGKKMTSYKAISKDLKNEVVAAIRQDSEKRTRNTKGHFKKCLQRKRMGNRSRNRNGFERQRFKRYSYWQ